MPTATPKNTVIDIETGQITQVTISADELAERENSANVQAAAIEAKATARASALAKLAELGLTQEEIAAL